MKEKKALLQDLVAAWSTYTEEDRSYQLFDFAEWLRDQHTTPTLKELPIEITQEIKHESLENTVALHFGKLVQFSNVWIKLTFKGTPFQSFQDYGMAQYIMHAHSPTKSEVTQWSTMERSTAFEVIRRLQKLGLVDEFPDENDKRTKRVQISKAGIKALQQADLKVDQISRLLVGNLSTDKQIELLKLLLELNDFHLREYQKGTDEVKRTWFRE